MQIYSLRFEQWAGEADTPPARFRLESTSYLCSHCGVHFQRTLRGWNSPQWTHQQRDHWGLFFATAIVEGCLGKFPKYPFLFLSGQFFRTGMPILTRSASYAPLVRSLDRHHSFLRKTKNAHTFPITERQARSLQQVNFLRRFYHCRR